MKSFTETKTTTFTPEWIKKEWLPFNKAFMDARRKLKNKFNSCRKCKHKFEDEEMMALASFGAKGNLPLCRKCADELNSDNK